MASVWKLYIGIIIVGILWSPVITYGSMASTGQNNTTSSNNTLLNDSFVNSSINNSASSFGTNQTEDVDSQISGIIENLSYINSASENSTILDGSFVNNSINASENNSFENITASPGIENKGINDTAESNPIDGTIADATGTTTRITVGTSDSDQRYPSIYEDNMVWLDFSNNEQVIHLYNISTGRETVIPNRSSYFPVVYKSLVGYSSEDTITDPTISIFTTHRQIQNQLLLQSMVITVTIPRFTMIGWYLWIIAWESRILRYSISPPTKQDSSLMNRRARIIYIRLFTGIGLSGIPVQTIMQISSL